MTDYNDKKLTVDLTEDECSDLVKGKITGIKVTLDKAVKYAEEVTLACTSPYNQDTATTSLKISEGFIKTALAYIADIHFIRECWLDVVEEKEESVDDPAG